MKKRLDRAIRTGVIIILLVGLVAACGRAQEATATQTREAPTSVSTEPPPTEQVETELPPPTATTTPPPTQTPALAPTSTSIQPQPSATVQVTPIEVEIPEGIRTAGLGFAGLYRDVPVNYPASLVAAADYALPVELGGLRYADQYTFSSAQTALLEESGFVTKPADWLEFFQLYEQVRYQDLPVFVTTDSIYHVYHLLFNKLLRDLERERLAPAIASLSGALAEAAEAQYESVRGTPLEDSARRVWGYFVVAQQLIEESPPPIPAPVADEVNEELALIDSQGGINMSPLLSLPEAFEEKLFCDPNATPEQANKFYCEDYSQYRPRGHYTRDEQLQRYFRTMMWYGRINLRLKLPRETRMALLITRLLRQAEVDGQPAADVWASVYDPTVFLVGKSDDLSFHEYGPLMDAVYGPTPDLAKMSDDALLGAFAEAARQLPPPQINSMWVYIWEDKEEATQGFRFMGQRFVLDAYIFGQLIWREVGRMGDERWLPKGLDVFAAMGNEEAYTILDEMGETEYLNYDEQMQKVREEIAGLEIDSWTQNLYWNWLYALQAIVAPKGEAYPPFMRTEAWARKDLHTALGSWTELKHDTILYAKQVMAELGGGGEIPPPIRAYVEPNPEAYARLLALTRMTRAGLEERGLITDNIAFLLNELDDTLNFLQSIAERELSGGAISNDEYERLKYYGGWLERLTLAAADPQGEGFASVFSEDEQAALVADVATDPNGQVLEEAIGRIYEIFVVVPDGVGGLQIAQGGTFSYYEFPWPINDRLTDEKWRAMVTAGEQPDQPEWTEMFIAD
jgi:hypothetical protein